MALDPLLTSVKTPQFFYDIHSSDRFQALCYVLDMNANSTMIIFCRTKKDVDHISEKLSLLNYSVSSYHGDISSSSRERLINRFIEKKTNILILTDIPNQLQGFPVIDLVLFLMVPQDPDSYIQRVIRLESSIEIKEVATLISPNEFKKIAFIKRVTKTDINQKQFLNAKEMVQLKKEMLTDQLNVYDFSTLDDSIKEYSAMLLGKHHPCQLVSYLLTHGFYKGFSADNYKFIGQANSQKKLKKVDKQDDLLDTERLFIALGKSDGIDNDMLIEFLFKETNIEKERFSDIKIFDTFSFFVVTQEDAEIVLEIFVEKNEGSDQSLNVLKEKIRLKRNKISLNRMLFQN